MINNLKNTKNLFNVHYFINLEINEWKDSKETLMM